MHAVRRGDRGLTGIRNWPVVGLQSAVLYQIIRVINAWYAVAILWTFIAAFLLAAGLMFVFPPATIGLLFCSLFGLGVAVVVAKLLAGIQRGLARHALSQRMCPICRQPIDPVPDSTTDRWSCAACDMTFSQHGEEVPNSAETSPDEPAPMPFASQPLEPTHHDAHNV